MASEPGAGDSIATPEAPPNKTLSLHYYLGGVTSLTALVGVWCCLWASATAPE